MKHLFQLLICLVLCAPLCGGTSQNVDLFAAAKAGDVLGVEAALAAGADANAHNEAGETALMAAVSAGSFPSARALLWAGAEAAATCADGRNALDFLADDAQDRQPIVLLVRCYAFLKAKGAVNSTHVKKPNLALIMEDTVNYLHPKIKAAYEVNLAELNGKPGVDDDGNGFVDDVYGWNPVTETPYQIKPEQLAAYLRNREVIARIIRIDTDRKEGRLSPDQAELELAGFTNPLAQIMGPHPDLTDKDFLNIVKSAAHGSHVAGIVLENSEGKARLSTLAIQSVGTITRPFGLHTEEIIGALLREAFSPEEFLQLCRTRLLQDSLELGKRYSRYIAASGAGLANLSFGYGYSYAESTTTFLLRRYISDRRQRDSEYNPEEEELKKLLAQQASEIYIAMAATWATVFFENPDVLFVCAAGNESLDNDTGYGEPAYFSRFFPNVLTVASVDQQGQASSFSNYGRHSVNVAALGENVLSTVIPEASIYMDGTSMATPAVTGVAALVRSWKPLLSASEVRQLIEYTAGSSDHLKNVCSSAGVIDRDALRQLFFGTASERAQVRAGMTITAVIFMDSDNQARARRDADIFSTAALKDTPSEAVAWWARAIFFDNTDRPVEARPFIDKAVKLEPANRRYWTTRAIICEKQSDHTEAVRSFTQALKLAGIEPNSSPSLKAGLLARRALAQLKLGDRTAATADTRTALELVPDADLPEELQALVK